MSEFADWYTARVTKYESVLAQALELPEEERELLMINVGLSLHESPRDEYDAYWEAEIKRRLEAVDSGEDRETDWEEVRHELMSGGRESSFFEMHELRSAGQSSGSSTGIRVLRNDFKQSSMRR